MIITITRKPFVGAVTDNVKDSHCGAINIRGTRIPYPQKGSVANNPLLRKKLGCKISHGVDKNPSSFCLKSRRGEMNINPLGRWSANIILSQEVVPLIDNQSMFLSSGKASCKFKVLK